MMRDKPEQGVAGSLTRRGFMQSAVAAISSTAIPSGASQAREARSGGTPQMAVAPAQTVHLHINGKQYGLSLEPRVTLLDALREVIGLTGTKKGCDRGQCGACTVLVDGRRINSCLTLAVMQEGREITTVEGLGEADNLHPLQTAFIESDAFQCGYCTPGQLCSGVAMLAEWRAGTASAVTQDVRNRHTELSEAEIRERMSGNICRCGAYPNIVAAVKAVADGNKT
jgi:xanthine dehydrogenase YagT iron-sulfur-binding subunit